MELREALAQLDSMNDEHWTQDGAPRLDVISGLVGSTVTRKDVIDAAPKFSRKSTELDAKEEIASGEVEASTPNHIPMLAEYLQEDILGERDFFAFLRDYPTSGLKDLQELVTSQLQEVEDRLRQGAEMKAALKANLARVNSRMKVELPDIDNQSAIREYLNSQMAMRAAKAEVHRTVLGGLDLSKLDPRAMIDRAFRRKNQRGTERPTGKM